MSNAVPRYQVEIDAMGAIYRELLRLDEFEQERALKWALDRIAYERTEASQPERVP